MADCGGGGSNGDEKGEVLRLKVGAIAAILVGSAMGVAIPLVGKNLKHLRVDSKPFVVIKAFCAGVILATGFVHVMGDAYERLSSECLSEVPWQKFPWTGLITMLAVLATLVVDAVGTEYYERKNGVIFHHGHAHGHVVASESRVAVDNKPFDEEKNAVAFTQGQKDTEHLRHVVISQVLELGIITHSVIIGVAVGVSDSPSTIKPLFVALVFHQFFEGFALGGCIAQAGFKRLAAFIMACFFAATTPFGIALGIGIKSSYNDNSQTSLIVQGVFDALSAGILIYMALVDLIAHDFLGVRMKGDRALQAMCYISLFAGALAMSSLAIWA